VERTLRQLLAMSTSIEANKALVRRFIEEVFVASRPDAVDELVADDFTPHSWPGVGPGREPLKQAQQRISQGLADARMTIAEMIAEGDLVAVRLTSHGRHTGEFMGMPASGQEYTIGEIHIFRVRDGKVAEHWSEADMLGMLRQLGAMPESMPRAT
jgi:steroid delta-isomerase-like uncharacterized protein